MRLVLVLVLVWSTLAAVSVTGQPKAAPVPDLFNLGPLGGKAALVTTGLPDGVKSALKIEQLGADTPAAKAGLKAADVVLGTPAAFKVNAYMELAAAIEAAEVTAEPVVVLRIRRGGETIDIKVVLAAIKASPQEAAPAGEFRDRLVEQALSWLVKQQNADGSWPCNLSVENGLVVQTSLSGLCLLATGNTPERGVHAEALLKAAQFVLENVGEQKQYRRLGGKNNDQTHWSLGYGGIFLAHVQHATDAKWLARSPLREIKKKLLWVKGRIERGMEDSGGFGHGPGGPNALGYVEFQCMSNLMLAALGCIKQCGIEPDAKALEKMLAFTRSCTDEDGGVAYSTTPPHDRIRSPARSAALANALAALGLKDDPLYAIAAKCAHGSVGAAFEGHSTPTMHQLAFAMCAWRDGTDSWAAYWKASRRELTMLRCPDGSFSYRPTAETAMLGINIDRDLTHVWTTSHWMLILLLDKGALPLWAGRTK